MNDPGHLHAIQTPAGMQTQQDRSGRLLLLSEKAILVGQGQMNTRRLHGSQGLN